MIQSAVIDIAESLALSLDDTAQLNTYYTDLLRILGQDEILTNAQAQDVTATARTYTTPDEAINLLAIFADARELPRTSELSLESLNKDWRAAVGPPRVHTLEDENENSFSLYPTPNTSVTPVSATFSSAFGTGFLPGQLSMIYTEERSTIPDWLGLYLAIAILEREFIRESNHRDVPTSVAASALATIVKKLLF